MSEEPVPTPSAADSAAPEGPVVPFWAHIVPFVSYFFLSHMLGEPAAWKTGVSIAAAIGLFLWLEPWRDRAIWAHLAPFALWLSLLTGLGEPAAWKYAARSAAGVVALLWLKPWRYYAPLNRKNLGLAALIGAVVFVAWVGMESAWSVRALPTTTTWYIKYLVMPLGRIGDIPSTSPYDPSFCGWPLAIVRLLGSTVIIAIAEEVFWRGFLFRWLTSRNFLTADLGKVDRITFWLVAVCFGFEHREWAAGILAGAAYGWLYLRTRDLWAPIIAHMLTNFLLGLYVLKFGAWQFW